MTASNSVHRPPLNWHKVTYITHENSLHHYNLSWKRKLNSNQLHHIFYADADTVFKRA